MVCSTVARLRTAIRGGRSSASWIAPALPGMLQLGLTQVDVDAILIANPARLLAFVEPGGAS